MSEAEAQERGTYVLEKGGAMRRFRRFIDNTLTAVIYAGWESPTIPLADLAHLGEAVEAEIYSPARRLPDGVHRWRTWCVDRAGNVTKSLEPEFAADGSFLREALYGPDGTLLSYTVYHYNDYGELYELTTHAPDGTVTGRQEAAWP